MAMLAQMSVIGYLFIATVIIWALMTVKRGQRRLAQQGTRRRSSDWSAEEPSVAPRRQAIADSSAEQHTKVPQATQDLLTQLDRRIAALEQWVREADRVAARLESALATIGPGLLGNAAVEHHESSVPGRAESRPSEVPDGPPQDASAPESGFHAAAPSSQADALRSAGGASLKPKPEMGEDGEAARLPADRRYDEIYTLADYGLDAGEIAQRVGSPVGEVQLILSLRGRRQV